MPYVGNKISTLDSFTATDAFITDDLTVTDDTSVGGDLTLTGSLKNSSGDLTIQAENDIILDAKNYEVFFAVNGTNVGVLQDNSNDFRLKPVVQDKDFKVMGNDGGSEITALTLDMSDAGAATFNNNVTAFSDRRLKSDIQTLENGLEKVEQLRGVTYTRDDNVDGGQQLGVIAQEVEEVFPQVVRTADDERGTKSVDYGRLTGALIEAVKELSDKVKKLETEIKN